MPNAGSSHHDIRKVLQQHWGYDDFRPMQADIINSVLSGRDTLGLMATGGGKSITFQVPALIIDGLTIVVTPLISLMKDQVDNLLSHGIRAFFLHSALTQRESRLALDKCRLGKAKMLYVSPEKLQSKNFISELKRLPIKLIVVDEAHCISQWGYDFRPSYLQIGALRALFPEAPVLALTASATPNVVDDICTQLKFRPDSATFRLSFNRSNISYVARKCEFKEEQLVRILSRVQGCGIVYVRSRKRTKVIADILRQAGISAEFYHAGLSAEDKNERQNRWKNNETRIMVATTAFGMGIDKPDVRIVVHYDPPTSLEEYYQEAGRAGRDGLESYAVALLTPSIDKGVLTRRLNDSFPQRDFLRETYNRLCVFLNVGIGEGFQHVFEFNLSAFCVRYKQMPVVTENALHLLERSGYIEYVEEVATRSRLMVLMTRNELYSLQLDDETERVFQFVLRRYTGIFADYEYISESLIASNLELTERTVYEALLKLGRMHVIHYVPHSSTPYIVFTRSRELDRDLVFPRTVYESRRQQMEQRINAMKQFLFDDANCRVTTLLRYFGEEPNSDCGKCDVCRARKAENHPKKQPSENETNYLKQSIIYALSHHPAGLTLAELATYLGTDTVNLAESVRNLLDAKILHRNNETTVLSVISNGKSGL
jgi:ATP-dependent DNA helicase RecQ